MTTDSVATSLDEYVRKYVQRRDDALEAEAEAKEAKRLLEEQRLELWEFLENAGIKTINHDLGRITRSAIIKATVSDREALARALDELGLLETFTRREFRRDVLNAFVREHIEGGDDLPEGIDSWVEKRITFTRMR